MYILGIDTTAVTATAAVCEEKNGVITNHALFSIKNGMTHSENLLPITDSVLNAMKISVKDLGLIAVDAGPGSFTGVRIGVATVKGLAFTYNTPVAAVSTLEALAANIVSDGIICPVMDARRNQFYNAIFENGKRLCDDRCISFEEIYSELKSFGKPVTLCGDGARLFASLCKGDETVKISALASEDQNALSVAQVGLKIMLDGNATSHTLLRPVYLRQSQAERMRCENDISADKK